MFSRRGALLIALFIGLVVGVSYPYLDIAAACRIPEISAAVVFYGLPPETAFKPSDIKVPLEGHYANTDDHITPT